MTLAAFKRVVSQFHVLPKVLGPFPIKFKLSNSQIHLSDVSSDVSSPATVNFPEQEICYLQTDVEVDEGGEYTSKSFLSWCDEHFIRVSYKKGSNKASYAGTLEYLKC